jgi:hypothetical protein
VSMQNIRQGALLSLVEVSPEQFKRIQDLEFPYRSVEYFADVKKIISLAFLESSASFFQFPILKLEDGGVGMTENQKVEFSMRPKVIKFSKCPKAPKFCAECEEKKKGSCMYEKDEKNENKTKMASDNSVDQNPEPIAVGLDEHMEEETGELGAIKSQINTLAQQTQKILAILKMLLEAEKEEGEGEEVVEEPEVGQKPEPVSMQKFSVMEKRLQALESHRSTSQAREKLQEICEDNPAINFEQEFTNMAKFSSEVDKLHYLNMLESKPVYQTTEATKFAQTSGNAVAGNILKKYSNKRPEVQKVAKRALKDYMDTTNQQNRRQADMFKMQWPSVEKWLDYHVEMEEISQGSYEKFCL